MSEAFLESVDSNGKCSRRHAIKVFAACAGGVALGGMTKGLADPPWGETAPAEMLAADGQPLRDGVFQSYGGAARQAYPTLAREPGGQRLWTSWVQLDGAREALKLRSFDAAGEEWGKVIALDGESAGAGTAGVSEIVCVGDRLLVAWIEYGPGGSRLLVRSAGLRDGTLSDVVEVTPAAAQAEYPALVAAGDRALLVWQAKPEGDTRYAVYGTMLNAAGMLIGEPQMITRSGASADCRKPAVAVSPAGDEFSLVYEVLKRGQTPLIVLVTLDANGTPADRHYALSDHSAGGYAPAVAYAPDGERLWVAWQSNQHGADGWDITPWYQLSGWIVPRHCKEPVAVRSDGVYPPEWTVKMNSAALQEGGNARGSNERGTLQGFELVRLAVSPRGVVCVLGRASHNYYVQYYSEQGQSPLYRLPKDGWGGRGRLLRGVFDDAGALWVTRRDLSRNVLERVGGFAELQGPPRVNWPEKTVYDYRKAIAERPALAGRTKRYVWPESPKVAAGLNVYFGDIHGHSWQSDGMGDPELGFERARDVFRDDFYALTDHDFFVGKRLNDSEWEQQKAIVEHNHEPGEFVTLFAQEWTTARTTRPHGWGHFNVYSADATIPLFDHTNEAFRDLDQLYAAIRKYEAIAIPHHIGWTGIKWEALDPAITPVVEMCSVHGVFEYEGNEPIAHRGGISGNFYRDGLARGLRIGVVGGSDQHGLTWHHGVCWKRNAFRAGLTGVWAPELTRAAILDTLRERRTFATTGVKAQVCFSVNGTMMGGEAVVDGKPEMSVSVSAPPEEARVKWLEIVRDGEVIHRRGADWPTTNYVYTDEGFARPAAGATVRRFSSYYLRVLFDDGNMAWSSPVWVCAN